MGGHRAIGDFKNGKEVGVVARPDCGGLVLGRGAAQGGGGVRVLVLATDGVWDVLDDAGAVDICAQYGGERDAAMAAAVVVQTARMLWEARPGSQASIDDISALVAFL